MPVENARHFGAAVKWLRFYSDMGVEIEMTDYPLRDCIVILRDKVDSIRNQNLEDIIVTFTRSDLRVLQDSVLHLDHLLITEAAREAHAKNKAKSKWTQKKAPK